uniref:NB-ARC domain-containing protein n=1 Tax=Quercus lobata TaxID=97700 RepID=A0A7N2M857_QUELO
MSYSQERASGKHRGSSINGGQDLAGHDRGPMSPKPSSPSEEPDSKILMSYCGGSLPVNYFKLPASPIAKISSMELLTEMKWLTVRGEEVNCETKESEQSDIRASVGAWLERSFNQILEKKPSACFLNCSKRYRESKEVEEKREKIKELREIGKFPDGLFYPTGRRLVEHVTGTLIQGQQQHLKCWLRRRRLEEEKKFLLILDDVWDKINLAILGVPDPEVHKGYKIILTSRRKQVCRSMITDVEIKMELLNDEEAWQLFSQKAGDVAHEKEIRPFAEAIAREGRGLPLAITIMGASMRGKTKVELWDNALKELQRSMPSGDDIEAEVYHRLKWSYDSLKGTVKMHDVVRDVAIWIASSSEDGCKSLVRSGIGLSEISVRELSNSDNLKRVFFMNNEITRLPDCMIQCSEVSTLLLQGNRALDTVPEKFLLGFKALRVLNLSRTHIQSLPHSLLQLSDLRALLLGSCGSLEELPPLESLRKLQKLDLSYTRITKLPTDMEKPERAKAIRHIQHGEEGGQATFEELRSLERLRDLSITLNRIPCDKSEDLSWINRLRRFHFHIIQANGTLRTHDKRSNIQGLDLSRESIGWYWGNSSSLHLDLCQGLTEMLEDFIKSDTSFANLKSLTISNCLTSLGRGGGCVARSDLLPNLEELRLWNVGNLKSISELASHLRLKFRGLKSIEVKNCNQMKYLLSCGDFNRTLPNLEVINVRRCGILDELFNYESRQNMAPDPIVPNLQKVTLMRLPKLITLCRHKEIWSCLEQVEVVRCNELRRLPFTNQNAATIKEIRGDSQWWNALEWDDDQTKSSLLPSFHPS